MSAALEFPIPGDAFAAVDWNGSGGSFVPCCEPCVYRGKAQHLHSAAVAIVRKHAATAAHRRALATEPEEPAVPTTEAPPTEAALRADLADAQKHFAAAALAADEANAIRNRRVADALGGGVKRAAIAGILGISVSRVAQLAEKAPQADLPSRPAAPAQSLSLSALSLDLRDMASQVQRRAEATEPGGLRFGLEFLEGMLAQAAKSADRLARA